MCSAAQRAELTGALLARSGTSQPDRHHPIGGDRASGNGRAAVTEAFVGEPGGAG
jgi:hypothetical protein